MAKLDFTKQRLLGPKTRKAVVVVIVEMAVVVVVVVVVTSCLAFYCCGWVTLADGLFLLLFRLWSAYASWSSFFSYMYRWTCNIVKV